MDHYTQLLRDLHTYLLRIRSVTEELQEGPQRLRRLQNKINQAEKSLADHLARLKALKVKIHENEVSLKANLDKLKKHRKDLDHSAAKKEFDALNVEIAALEKRNSDLEDETLQMMGKSEELAVKTPDFEQAVANAKQEHSLAQTDQQAHLKALQDRLEEAKKLAAEKAALLPDEFKKEYRRVELTEGSDTLAPLNGKSCSACYTDVTSQQFTIIKSGKISACKTCARLLYVPD